MWDRINTSQVNTDVHMLKRYVAAVGDHTGNWFECVFTWSEFDRTYNLVIFTFPAETK